MKPKWQGQLVFQWYINFKSAFPSYVWHMHDLRSISVLFQNKNKNWHCFYRKKWLQSSINNMTIIITKTSREATCNKNKIAQGTLDLESLNIVSPITNDFTNLYYPFVRNILFPLPFSNNPQAWWCHRPVWLPLAGDKILHKPQKTGFLVSFKNLNLINYPSKVFFLYHETEYRI